MALKIKASTFTEHCYLEVTGSGGMVASMRLELDDSSATYRNDRCEVYINGESASKPFGCKFNFTKMQWEDVVGDGKPELVVRTISGDQSYIWNDLVAEKGCFHQRMLIYTWDGKNADQVANVVGCIRRSDLFGVRLRDYDEDGELEILAAAMWPQFLDPVQPDGFSQDYVQVSQLVEIYEWDGEKFVIGWTLDE